MTGVMVTWFQTSLQLKQIDTETHTHTSQVLQQTSVFVISANNRSNVRLNWLGHVHTLQHLYNSSAQLFSKQNKTNKNKTKQIQTKQVRFLHRTMFLCSSHVSITRRTFCCETHVHKEKQYIYIRFVFLHVCMKIPFLPWCSVLFCTFWLLNKYCDVLQIYICIFFCTFFVSSVGLFMCF